jgi:Fic family protein
MPLRVTGTCERTLAGGESVEAFLPAPLPPHDPPLAITGKLAERLRLAEQTLARLGLAGQMFPPVDRLRYAFVRKEAVLSPPIEGTQASLADLVNFEAAEDIGPSADVEAVAHARERLQSAKGLPLSIRVGRSGAIQPPRLVHRRLP